MILHMFKGVLGIFVFMAVWIAVQSYLRRRMERAPDCDVLDDMAHGCGCCGHSGSCRPSHCENELTVIGRQS